MKIKVVLKKGKNVWAPFPAIRSNAAPTQEASHSGVSTAIGGAKHPGSSSKYEMLMVSFGSGQKRKEY